jgi:hypothetical protein
MRTVLIIAGILVVLAVLAFVGITLVNVSHMM